MLAFSQLLTTWSCKTCCSHSLCCFENNVTIQTHIFASTKHLALFRVIVQDICSYVTFYCKVNVSVNDSLISVGYLWCLWWLLLAKITNGDLHHIVNAEKDLSLVETENMQCIPSRQPLIICMQKRYVEITSLGYKNAEVIDLSTGCVALAN